MPVQVDRTVLQLKLRYATRALQWFPFQSRQVDMDQILADRLDLAVNKKQSAVPLTPGECVIISRWYRNLIPSMVSELDEDTHRYIEEFLNR
jgi:hypothetical protein